MGRKKKELTLRESFGNNLYAMKLGLAYKLTGDSLDDSNFWVILNGSSLMLFYALHS